MRVSRLSNNSIVNNSAVRIAMGICFMFICARIYIPLKPVQITFHTAGAIILALCFSRQEAMSMICSFVALGFLGAPICADMRPGFSVLVGPSGGYYFGMIVAVYVITTMRMHYGDKSYFKLFVYSMIGSMFIYLVGLSQLSLFVGADKALQFGLYPFILTGIVKNIVTSTVVRYLRK